MSGPRASPTAVGRAAPSDLVGGLKPGRSRAKGGRNLRTEEICWPALATEPYAQESCLPPPPSTSNAKCAEVHRSPSLTVCQRPRALGQDLGRCGLDRACAGARGRAPSRVNGGLPAEERAGQGNPFLWLPFHLDRDFLTDGNNASLSV